MRSCAGVATGPDATREAQRWRLWAAGARVGRAAAHGAKSAENKVAGPYATVEVKLLLRTCMYRWAPGKRTTIRTEPAPLEMLKAAGVVTCCLREGQHPPKTEIGASAAKGKGPGEMNSLQLSDQGAIMGRAGCTGGVSGRQTERSVWPVAQRHSSVAHRGGGSRARPDRTQCATCARAGCAGECAALTRRDERVEETMPAFIARVPDRGPGQSVLMSASRIVSPRTAQ